MYMAIYCQEFEFYPIDISGVLVKMEPCCSCVFEANYFSILVSFLVCQLKELTGLSLRPFPVLIIYKSELEKLK